MMMVLMKTVRNAERANAVEQDKAEEEKTQMHSFVLWSRQRQRPFLWVRSRVGRGGLVWSG